VRILLFQAIEKRWGPNLIRFGVTWDGEIKGKQDGNALINFKATRLNSLNAEWLTDISVGTLLSLQTEFYQPVDPLGIFFVAPRFEAYRTNQDVYLNTDEAAYRKFETLASGFYSFSPIYRLQFLTLISL